MILGAYVVHFPPNMGGNICAYVVSTTGFVLCKTTFHCTCISTGTSLYIKSLTFLPIFLCEICYFFIIKENILPSVFKHCHRFWIGFGYTFKRCFLMHPLTDFLPDFPQFIIMIALSVKV